MGLPTNNIRLPIDAFIPEVLAKYRASKNLIIQATPGSGKTTRIPRALLEATQGQILVLEPRRLAARLSADRVAFEMYEKVGESVGYQIRFQNVSSAKTRLRFLTEGLLLRHMLRDPHLKNVSCVVLDEFHERHLHSDVALALLKFLQSGVRPDLKIVVMSATLDVTPLQNYLNSAGLVDVQAPSYPVSTTYRDAPKDTSLARQVSDAVLELMQPSADLGHILVFLPGAAEIRRAADELASLASRHHLEVLELRADLSPTDQERVFQDLGKRKVILATNIAETSLTIDGVSAVIDSGIAKIPSYAPWSGLPTLSVRKVSQASCVQRAGRAGRTGPGKVIRLFSERDFLARPAFERPEIERLDVTQTVLETQAMLQKLGAAERADFSFSDLKFLTPPPLDQREAAERVLTLLGATDGGRRITPLGDKMSSLPLHPRLSRMALAGMASGISDWALAAAAVLSERAFSDYGARSGSGESTTYGCDLSHRIHELYGRRGGRGDGAQTAIQRRRVEETARQIASSLGLSFDSSTLAQGHANEKLRRAVLAGFPERVAKRRVQGHRGRSEYSLCLGGGGVLAGSSGVGDAEWIVVLDAEESLAGSSAQAVNIRFATGIDPDTLLEGPESLLREITECEWENPGNRVRCFERIYYGQLVLEERQTAGSDAVKRPIIEQALLEAWPKPFADASDLFMFTERVALIQKHFPEVRFPDLAGEDFAFLISHICENKTSFSAIVERELESYIEDLLSHDSAKLLRDETPTSIVIGAGRRIKVNYESGKPPWIASRLQDFFGQGVTPSIASGRLPLTVHLLAPNLRAVQVTQDLASFWRNSYQALRRDLSRHYPRHFWPEDPLTAEPPPPRPPRRR